MGKREPVSSFARKLQAAGDPATITVMALSSPSLAERRRFTRHALPARFSVQLLQAHRSTAAAEGVNLSEGGLCLRLREMLEVRSLVRLQLTPGNSGPRERGQRLSRGGQGRRPVRCTGRVTWVVQRLDLRGAPPFLFDTGIELVDPPAVLRQAAAQAGAGPALPRRGVRSTKLGAVVVRGREYVPRVEHSAGPPPRWHLVVRAEGVPCVSEHYPSERAALAAWARFRRRRRVG